MPVEFIYEPWKAPLSIQRMAGCVLGLDYPRPIVNHEAVSQRNKDMMEELKENFRKNNSIREFFFGHSHSAHGQTVREIKSVSMKLAFSEVPGDFPFGAMGEQLSKMNELIKNELRKKTSSVDKGKVSNMRLILQEIAKNIDGLDGVDDDEHPASVGSKALVTSGKKVKTFDKKHFFDLFILSNCHIAGACREKKEKLKELLHTTYVFIIIFASNIYFYYVGCLSPASASAKNLFL